MRVTARPVDVLVVGPPDLLVTSIVAALAGAGIGVTRLPLHNDVPGVLDDRRGSVLIIDVDHPDADLVIRRARRRGVVVLALGTDSARDRAAAAIMAGAAAWVRTSSSLSSLVETVRAAADGRLVMSAEARATWSAVHQDDLESLEADIARLESLSPREREVLALLADGHRAGAVAEDLVLGIATVRSHIHKILRKLGVHSQEEAAAVLRAVARRREHLPSSRRNAG